MNNINFPVGVTSPHWGAGARLLGQSTIGGRNEVQIYDARYGGHHSPRRKMDSSRYLRMGCVAWHHDGSRRCFGWLRCIVRGSVDNGHAWREEVI